MNQLSPNIHVSSKVSTKTECRGSPVNDCVPSAPSAPSNAVVSPPFRLTYPIPQSASCSSSCLSLPTFDNVPFIPATFLSTQEHSNPQILALPAPSPALKNFEGCFQNKTTRAVTLDECHSPPAQNNYAATTNPMFQLQLGSSSQEINSRKITIQNLLTERSELERGVNELTNENGSVKEYNQKIAQIHQSFSADNECLTKENSELKQTPYAKNHTQTVEQERDNLRIEIKGLVAANEEGKKKFHQKLSYNALMEEKLRIQHAYAALERAYDDLEDKENMASDDATTWKLKVQDLTSDIGAISRHQILFSNKLITSISEKNNLEKILEKREHEIKDLQNTVGKLKVKIHSLHKTVEKTNAAANKMESNLSALELENEEAISSLEKMKEKQKAAVEENAEKFAILDKLTVENESLKNQLIEKESMTANMESRITDLSSQLKDQQTEVGVKDFMINEKNDLIEKYTKTIAELEMNIESIKEEAITKEETLIQIRGNFNTNNEEMENFKLELIDKNGKIKAFQDSLKERNELTREQSEAILENARELENNKQSLFAEKLRLDNVIAGLQVKLEQATNVNTTKEQQHLAIVNYAHARLQKSDANIHKLKQDFGRVNVEKENLKQVHAKKCEKLEEEKKKEIIYYKSTIEKLNSKVTGLQTEIDSMKQILEEKAAADKLDGLNNIVNKETPCSNLKVVSEKQEPSSSKGFVKEEAQTEVSKNSLPEASPSKMKSSSAVTDERPKRLTPPLVSTACKKRKLRFL